MVNGILYSAPYIVHIVKISNSLEAPDHVAVDKEL